MVSMDLMIYRIRSRVGNTFKHLKRCVRRCIQGNAVLTYKHAIITDHKVLEQIMDSLGFDAKLSVMGTVYRQFHHRGSSAGSFIVSFPSEQMVDRPLMEYLVFIEPVNKFLGQEVFRVSHSRNTKISTGSTKHSSRHRFKRDLLLYKAY